MNDTEELDPDRVAFFAAQYAGMDDEELSTLKVTRGQSLVDEARVALQREIARRDPAGFGAELAGKVADVKTQATIAQAKAREERRISLQTRYAIWIFGALSTVAGLAIGVFGDRDDFTFAYMGVGLICVYEWRRRTGSILYRMFSKGGGSK